MVRGLACIQVGALLGRRAAGLTDAERLKVESHCSECHPCREEARLLAGICARASQEPVLTLATRELLLRRAFDAASLEPSASSVAPAPSRSRRWAAAGLIAAAALAVMVLLFGSRPMALRPSPERDHVAAGVVSWRGRQAAAGAAIDPGSELASVGRARLALGPADVELAPDSGIVWRPAESSLVLVRGAVQVTVEHVEHQHFRVATPAFMVEVVGTAFQVDLRGVRVTRGTVHVLSSDGRDVIAVLPAGGAWSTPARALVASSQSATAPSAALAEAPPSAAPAGAPLAVLPGTSRDADATESVRRWLSAARRALSAHHTAEAERAVDAALRLHPTSYELAEARTLLAECAGASGDGARAVRLYLDVARQFSTLPAAENALFAAARTEDRVGASDAAQRLFTDYLRRYPGGRFRDEAERHLLRLRAPSKAP